MDEFRVWIGCFACYSEGRLIGQWYPANEADGVTTKDLHAASGIVTDEAGCLAGSDAWSGPHEELWCFDVEAPIKEWAHEMSPMTAAKLAHDFNEASTALDICPTDAYLAWLGNQGLEPSWETAQEADEHYVGGYNSFRDYADEMADSMMISETEPVLDYARNEFMARYFDYAAHARDLAYEHTVLDAKDGGVYVFWD